MTDQIRARPRRRSGRKNIPSGKQYSGVQPKEMRLWQAFSKKYPR
jgi:hypothetical protein